MIDVGAALARLFQFDFRAQIGPGDVVELQIAAAGIVKCLDRLLIGGRQIVEDGVAIGIGVLAHRVRLEAEVHHGRRRDRHLRHDLGMRLQELEMFDHWVSREIDLARDPEHERPSLHALELDAVVAFDDVDAF